MDEHAEAPPTVALLLFREDWQRDEFRKALQQSSGDLVVVFPTVFEMQARDVRMLLRDEAKKRKIIIATKHKLLRKMAREENWTLIERLRDLQPYLHGNMLESEAVRIFSPHFWRSHIRTQLQRIGLLSLPKVRIWLLCAASAGVFAFIFFKLLPSATIHVWPLQETITQTVNVYLVSSGAQIPSRVRTLPLRPLTVRVDNTLTFDEIGKEFTGKNAEMAMTIVNDAEESYALKKGTRLTNQAGMVFRLQEDVVVPAHASTSVRSVADAADTFNEILGERGNVPAGLRWTIPGLSLPEQALVYGRNDEVAVGGATSFRNVLKPEDLTIAQKKLERELLLTARQRIDEERQLLDEQQQGSFEELRYEELTSITFEPFDLPEEFLGQSVNSVPITGAVQYTVLLYDENALFSLLHEELLKIASADKIVLPESINKDQLVLHVIDAPWDAPRIDWVKITVDLSGTQRFKLDPLTPTGARFSKNVRDAVTGKNVQDAERIIKNMPEVERVSISVWPPWNHWLPSIPSNIYIEEER